MAELAKASIMLCTNSRFLAAELGSPAHKPLGPWQQVAAPAGLLDAVAGIPDTGPHAVRQLREYATQALRTARLKQSSRVTNPHDLSVDEIGAIVVYTKEWARAHGTSLCASPHLLTGHHFLRTTLDICPAHASLLAIRVNDAARAAGTARSTACSTATIARSCRSSTATCASS